MYVICVCNVHMYVRPRWVGRQVCTEGMYVLRMYVCLPVCMYGYHAQSQLCLRPLRMPSSSSTAEPPSTPVVEPEQQDSPDHGKSNNPTIT